MFSNKNYIKKSIFYFFCWLHFSECAFCDITEGTNTSSRTVTTTPRPPCPCLNHVKGPTKRWGVVNRGLTAQFFFWGGNPESLQGNCD